MPAGCAGAPHPSLRGFECPRPVCAFEPAHGNVVTEANGYATVTLPEWFEALNRDFRYQLTCIGGFAPVYVAEKVAGNRFKVAGGQPGLEVSRQVTGIRQDAWANAHRVPVEEEKPAEELGTYLAPEVWGLPEELGLPWQQEVGIRGGRERALRLVPSAAIIRSGRPAQQPVSDAAAVRFGGDPSSS
jgi:hypothetical protein